ncbi:MAG: triose-phosphate isomerase, partial [Patescibacteria group bacterium]
DADIVAYEPVGAIGSGQSEDPRASNEIIARLKEKTKVPTGLYGGSVTPKNVSSFVREPSIDGVLVGGVSLDATKFGELIHNASNA